MQNPERGFCHKGSAVASHSADGLGDPCRVAREQLVVFLGAHELDNPQLHHELVDQFLRAFLGQRSVFHIAPDIDVKEVRISADAHCRAVLIFDRAQITEIQPLNRFLRVLGRS